MIGVVSPGGLRRSWFLSVTMGECAGFAAPALTAALLSGSADRVFVPAMLMAGAIEGAALGSPRPACSAGHSMTCPSPRGSG